MKTLSQHRYPFAPGAITGGPRRTWKARLVKWLDKADEVVFFIAAAFVLTCMLGLSLCLLFGGLLGFNILDGAPFL